jgi:hypothetical protein
VNLSAEQLSERLYRHAMTSHYLQPGTPGPTGPCPFDRAGLVCPLLEPNLEDPHERLAFAEAFAALLCEVVGDVEQRTAPSG